MPTSSPTQLISHQAMTLAITTLATRPKFSSAQYNYTATQSPKEIPFETIILMALSAVIVCTCIGCCIEKIFCYRGRSLPQTSQTNQTESPLRSCPD